MQAILLFGAVISFGMGSVLGSFANVLVYRLKEASTLWGRSHCRSCGSTIRARHLVPIFSWLWLRGRCASCGKIIHFQYPLIETLGGLLAVVAFFRHPFFLAPHEASLFFFELFFGIDLLVMAAFDLRWKLLPLEFIAVSAAAFVFWNLLSGRQSILSLLIGCAVGVVFLGVQTLVSRGRWMGSGDPWMSGMIGASLGWPGIAASLYLTYMVGGLFAFLLFAFGFIKRGFRIPFGPLLAFGAVLAVWYGPWLEMMMRKALNGG